MIVRCWGSRGSISVSGSEYIKYGGDTTCMEIISSGGDTLIIDAGTGIRKLGNLLLKENRLKVNLILTHPHWDHLSGFPFFKPLYTKKTTIDIRGPRTTQEYIKAVISRTMTAPYFPVELTDIASAVRFHSTSDSESFDIGSLKIKTIPLNHTNTGVGFRVEEGGKSFVFLTDNELHRQHPGGKEYEDYVKFSDGADILYHDAEYTPQDHHPGWGHSRFTDAIQLAMDAHVKKIGLFHHNQDRTDDEVDAIVKAGESMIKAKNNPLECFAVSSGLEFKL